MITVYVSSTTVFSKISIENLDKKRSLVMNGSTHENVTKKALLLLSKEKNDNFYAIGESNLLKNANSLSSNGDDLCKKNSATDHVDDLEFVDVDAGSGIGRDDPHKDEWDVIDDEPHYSYEGFDFTSFQHFIDLGHKGKYDDYDGYSYQHGSACRRGYQSAQQVISRKGHGSLSDCMDIAEWLSNQSFGSFDDLVNGWFNDEYVHAPGMKWYKNCSPGVWRYTFCESGSKYNQILSRYPLAQKEGKRGCGIPYSVFTPVDNLGRYWYERFLISGDVLDLGPVMHAIQDACVPHHTSGYLGNWHVEYEDCLDQEFNTYSNDCDSAVLKLYRQWSANSDGVQTKITYPQSINLIPNKSWRIDHLITWLACQSHDQYVNDYNNFCDESWRDGKEFLEKQKPRKLLDLAVAMSMLVFDKAREEYIKEKKYGSNKVDTIHVTIYADKEKSSDINLQMRLFYKECGGSIDLDILESMPTAKKASSYVYHKDINVSRYNIDEKKFCLELERCKIKNFQFTYIISYKTADNVWHVYADTNSLNKITVFSGEENCVTLPRRQSAIIRKIRFNRYQSRRYNAETANDVALKIQSRGCLSQYVRLPSGVNCITALDVPVDSEDCKISITIMGKDAWLPSYIHIDLLDEKGKIIYAFSKNWPDHLWLTYKSKSKNLPEYDLIQNCVDVFNPPK